jgi:nucleotide-binding universal stress UspA family protein
VAEEVEDDLIYLGAKGMSALKLLPLGNAYEEALRHTYKTVSMGSAHPEGEGIEEAS